MIPARNKETYTNPEIPPTLSMKRGRFQLFLVSIFSLLFWHTLDLNYCLQKLIVLISLSCVIIFSFFFFGLIMEYICFSNAKSKNFKYVLSFYFCQFTKKDASEVNSYYNDDFVTQHDILRELATHQSSQESEEQRSRLIMNISGNNLPKWRME